MLNHKLCNLLKLYRTASRVESLNTISHCSRELDKVLLRIGGQEVDPVTRLYLRNLNIVHQDCKDIVRRKSLESTAA